MAIPGIIPFNPSLKNVFNASCSTLNTHTCKMKQDAGDTEVTIITWNSAQIVICTGPPATAGLVDCN